MKEPGWHFPAAIDEAFEAGSLKGAVYHAGGTGILMAGLKNVEDIVDLSGLRLDFIDKGDEIVRIGAMATYREIAETFGYDCLLGKAAHDALPPALSNRVTIGGNLAMAPIWSDMAAPMLALNTEALIYDGDERYLPIAEYLADTELRRNSLLLEVRFERLDFVKYHHREKRTEFDYPAFTIAMLAIVEDDEIIDSRIAITGTKQKFQRLEELEILINGRGIRELDTDKILENLELEFRDKAHGSAEYLREIATVQLRRGIEVLKGELR